MFRISSPVGFLGFVLAALWTCLIPALARAESIVAPIQITVPSVVYDTVGSSNSPRRNYFSFNAVAGTSYSLSPQRVDPVSGEIYGPAAFVVSVYTNDSAQTLVAEGPASNLSPFVSPPLQNGNYLIVVSDSLVGYATIVDYYLTTTVAATGGTPTGPIPGSAAIAVASIASSSASVTGGSKVTFTVTLSAPAPSGGTTVSLSSSSSVAPVPASVTIPAGARTATFVVTTSKVSKRTSATVTAKVGSTSKSATITVTR
jgi:hypothetical protein